MWYDYDPESYKRQLSEYDILLLKELGIDPEKHSMLDEELNTVLESVQECLKLRGETP
jgi:hypothetical protein